jgi:HK97 family phage portal protein
VPRGLFAKPRDLIAEDEARTIRALGAAALERRSGDYTSTLDRPSMRLIDALGASTSSGARVTETTAATIPTVSACVGFLADMIAMLPCKMYRKTADGREEATEKPAHQLVSTASGSFQTPFEQRRQAMTGVGFGGNGYLRVFRDQYFEPGELQWLRPCDVKPELVKFRDGRMTSRYILDGVREPLTRTDIVHVHGLSFDGLTGMSPIRALRESIGLSLTQRDQAGKIYANGARFPGFLTTPANLQAAQVKEIREAWQAAQAGSENAGKTPVLHGGITYAATNGMTFSDAEFLESRKFERTEIATLYRIPEVLLGNSDKASSWGTGIETLTNGFLAFSLGPWLVNWEQALGFTLLTEQEKRDGYYFRFTRGALLQVALEAQAKFFREMRDIGAYSVNDVRRKLEENDLPDHIGDDYRLPFNGSGGRPAEQGKPQAAAS